jgi:hypothetical protein
MKFLDRTNAALDWATQILYMVIDFLFRLVALASLPALLVWVVLASANFLLGGAVFAAWPWLFPVMTIVQIIGLDCNVMCLLADAALDRLPDVANERVLMFWKVRQIVRSVVIGLGGLAIILPLVLVGSSPIWPGSGPVPGWLMVLRGVAVVLVLVMNVVLSPVVRRRIQAEMFGLQAIYVQKSRGQVKEGNRL